MPYKTKKDPTWSQKTIKKRKTENATRVPLTTGIEQFVHKQKSRQNNVNGRPESCC